MKILMINDNDPDAVVGGSEHYLADLTRALHADGHEIHWFVLAPETPSPAAPRSDSARDIDAKRGKRVFRPGRANRWVSILRRVAFYPDLYRELTDCLARFHPDVVHLHNNYRYPFTVLAATRGPRVVQTVHDYCAIYPTAYCSQERTCAGRSIFAALRHGCMTWRLLATEAGLLYGRRFLDRRLVDAFIAPSRNLAIHLERMGHANVFHVPNLRLPPRAEPTPVPDRQVVLYVGGLVEHKGVATLLAAFARLAGEVPQAELWLVGDGPDANDLKATTAEHGLCQVRFLGQRSPDELACIYPQARAVVLPSLWLENAPLVAIEAAAYGRAIVASRVGGLPELVDDGQTGRLFDRGDTAGLAEQLRLLLTDQTLAGDLGAAAHQRLAELRSPGKHLERLHAVYDRALH